MDNFEEILRVLAEDNGSEIECENCESCESCESDGSADSGLFSGLDPELLIRLLALMETLNQPDDNERFLLALKPLLREENRPKIDSAVRLLKLLTILPFIRESGLFENFNI